MLINVLLTVATLLFLAGGILWTVFVRRLHKTQIRFISVLSALVLSIIVTIVLKGTVFRAEEILPWIGAKLDPAFMELLSAVPSLCDIVLGTVSGLITPILFFAVFMILNFLAWIIYLFIVLIIGSKLKAADEGALLAMPRVVIMSVLQTLIILVVCIIPLAAYSGIAPVIMESISEADVLPEDTQATVDSTLKNYVRPLDNNPVVGTFRLLGGSALTDAMTDFQVRDNTVHIKDELGTLSKLVCHAVVLVQNDFANYGSKEEAALIAIAGSFGESTILPTIAGELVYNATDAWMKDETFVGLDNSFVYIDKSGTFDEFIEQMLKVLHEDSRAGNEQALCSDLSTTADILAIMIRSDVFKSLGDSDAMVDAMSQPGVISNIVVELESNQSMSVLISEIMNVGLRAIANSLGVQADAEGIYNDMMKAIAAGLNDSKGKTDEAQVNAVVDSVTQAFDEAGIPVNSEVIETYASVMIEDLVKESGDEEITPEDVIAFFAVYAQNVEENLPETGNHEQSAAADVTTPLAGVLPTGNNWKEALRGTKYETMSDAELRACGPAVLGRVHVTLLGVLNTDDENAQAEIRETAKNMLREEYSSYADMNAATLNLLNEATDEIRMDKVQLGRTSSLKSADNMAEHTQLITLDILLLDVGKAVSQLDPTAIEQDAKAIETVFRAAKDIMNQVSNSKDLNLETLASSIGLILDEMGGTSLFGGDKSAELFMAVLQSEIVREKADLDMTTATQLAQKGSSGEKLNYQQTFVTISQTVTTMENWNQNNGELTDEDIEKLIRDINPQSAGMMEIYITSDRLITSYRVPSRYAVTAAPLLSNIFCYMADADMSDQEYKKESTAINNIMTLTMAARENAYDKTHNQTLFGKRGIMGEDAIQVVDDLMASKSLAYSLRATDFENDPFELSQLLKKTENIDERADLEDAIRWYYEDNSDDETYETLSLLAKLFGLGSLDDILAA